jgi:hypothetical protein
VVDEEERATIESETQQAAFELAKKEVVRLITLGCLEMCQVLLRIPPVILD